MSKTVKIRKGLDIRLVGKANKIKSEAPTPKTVAIRPSDFHGVNPKMMLKEGADVKIGQAIFHDKYNDAIKFVSPVNGKLEAIVRGEKRRILEVVITLEGEQDYSPIGAIDFDSKDAEALKATMLEAGLWPYIKQRPIDVVAHPNQAPKAIFVSAFDSSPLAPDFDFALHGKNAEFQAGLDVLSKLTTGKVHLTLNGKAPADAVFTEAKGVQINKIYGPHPAGNVGTQIHHIDPINKGEFVWTVNAQDVVIIGRYFLTGRYNPKRVIALTGSEIKDPQYFEIIPGSNVSELLAGGITSDHVRVISGNVLTGDKIAKDGHLGFYHNQITVIPEGDQMKFVLTKGWMSPGLDKFSNNRLLLSSWIGGKKQYRMDTNTNGEERAFVVTGELDRVFPFDILPMQLTKAAITHDIDAMENLGIYEVAPEDFALCEYVCSSKIDIQDKIRQGLDLIQSECM